MFYISSITGELVPVDPASVAKAGVNRADEVSAIRETAYSAAVDVAAPTGLGASSLVAFSDDSAVYDGHAIPRTADLLDVGHISNTAWVGAVRSYRIQASDRIAETLPTEPEEGVESIDQSSAIESEVGESPLRVNPIRQGKRHYEQPAKERRRAVMARDLMSAPVFAIHAEVSALKAKRLFGEHKYRHIPVVSDSNRVIGILSDRDFIGVEPAGDEPVRNRMVTNVLTAHPETEIQAIAEVIVSHHIGCLPIVDESGILIGLLTRTDILRAIVNHAPIELWT